VRNRPHLQAPKILRATAPGGVHPFSAPPGGGGEEVTRNLLSYKYIKGEGLDTRAGVNAFLAASKKADLPIGAIEIKADWAVGAVPGAYQFVAANPATTYSLLGLHIMAKVAPAPSDPFHSEDPSWFWTTFEFKDNPGLANAQALLTYKDALAPADSLKLLTQAGLASTPFVNYRCNGSQIRFSDAEHPVILLGNTKMESFAGLPKGTPPSEWTGWTTSCHTCHAEASAKSSDPNLFFGFHVWIGKITDPSIDDYTSLDFIWSIPFNAR
jgi:hypothetical protein